MANIMQLLPEVTSEEQMYIQNLIKDMDEQKQANFAAAYRARRKDGTTLLLLTLLGFIGIAGVQRFITGQVGMGVLYLLTAGFCGIGTIVDLVISKNLAFEYNQKQAAELLMIVKAS